MPLKSVKSGSNLAVVDMLNGLSISAEAQNIFAESALKSIKQDAVRAQAEPKRMLARGGTVDLDLNTFTQSMDKVVASLEDLKNIHFDFSGERVMPGSPMGKSRTLLKTATTAEELDKKRERLDQYKMQRKIEPELPPLQPLPSSDLTLHLNRDQSIVRRNATPAALECWSLANRRERLNKRKEEHSSRLKNATSARQLLEAQKLTLWEESIEKKKHRCAEVHQKAAPVEAAAPVPTAAELWLTHLAVGTVAEHMRGNLEHEWVRRREEAEKAKQKFRSTTRFLMHSVRLTTTVVDAKHDLSVLGDMVRNQKQREETNTHITRVAKCLEQWRVAGRLFLHCRQLYYGILQVQRWWRSWRQWNRDTLARLSRRWDRIQIAIITKEFHKAEETLAELNGKGQDRKPRLPGHSPNAVVLPPVTLEERIHMDKVQEEVRINFIRHELRAKRYALLPRILLWEDEVREWNKFYDDQRFSRDAVKTIAQDAALESFRWPPMRPTYTPREHGPEGVAGDQIISEWFQVCRKNPNGWTQVPNILPKFAAGRAGQKREASKEKSPKRRQSVNEDSPLFGVVATDEDLAEWGLTVKSMPGLQDGNGPETPRVMPF